MEGNVIREHGVGTVGVLSWVRLLALHSSNLRMESLFYCLTSPQPGTSGLLQHRNTYLEGLTRRYSFVAHIWFVPHQLAINFSSSLGTTMEPRPWKSLSVTRLSGRSSGMASGLRQQRRCMAHTAQILGTEHRAQSTDRSHFHP